MIKYLQEAFRYVDPFRRCTRSKSKAVRNSANIGEIKLTYKSIRKTTIGLSTPTEHPQNSRELFRLQQASPELSLRPLDGLRVFFYGYFIYQPLITAYSVTTSFIDCSDYVRVFLN